jgi:nucleotide-binding universal stress UspA family protein
MLKRIVVPLDGTPLGEAVLPHVAELARALGAAVEVVHVVPPTIDRGKQAGPRPLPTALLGAPSVLPQHSPSSTVLRYRTDPSEVDATRRYVERVAEWLRGEGLLATAEVVEGPEVASEVLKRVGPSDLLALAAAAEPGGSRVGRLVFGSISERLIHDARTPVLLVRVPNAQG